MSWIDLIRAKIDSFRSDDTGVMEEEDLVEALKLSKEEGTIGGLEVRMILSVLELDDTTVKEILVPRPDIESIPEDMKVSNIISHIADKPHTRYPVVNDSNDQVVGFIDIKDVVSLKQENNGEDIVDGEIVAGDIARDIPIFPETTRVDEILVSLQEDNKQIAAVIDEWGSLEGILTIEDIIEVIVGEIRDEFDDPTEEPKIQKTGDHYLADGHVPIRRINRVLGTDFKVQDGAETVAGLILSGAGEVPEEGFSIQIEDIEFKIRTVIDNRISKIQIRKKEIDS